MENDLVALGLDTLVDGVENAGDDLAVLVPGGTLTGQCFQQHPHGSAVLVDKHVALERIDHIFGGQIAAFMKLDPFADLEGIGLAARRNAAVFQGRHLGGDQRYKLVRIRTVEKNQWLVYIPQPLGRGHIVGDGRI